MKEQYFGERRIAMILRFVLGALLGMLVGFRLLVSVSDATRFVLGVVCGGLIGGWLSVRFGPRAWESLRHFRWLAWWL